MVDVRAHCVATGLFTAKKHGEAGPCYRCDYHVQRNFLGKRSIIEMHPSPEKKIKTRNGGSLFLMASTGFPIKDARLLKYFKMMFSITSISSLILFNLPNIDCIFTMGIFSNNPDIRGSLNSLKQS